MSSKQREALKQIHDLLSVGGMPDTAMCIRYEAAYQIAKAALAEPLRNCDVGTVYEQEKRFDSFVLARREDLSCRRGCPVNHGVDFGVVNCVMRWSQMPYEEERNEEQ